MPSYYCLITVLSDAAQPPLGIWGGGNVPYPTPPIYMPPGAGGGPPLGTWGGGNVPMPSPPIYVGPPAVPGAHPDHGLPGQGLGTWGGGNVPMPSPPIYFPPPGGQPPLGIWGPPDMPPGFWGGGMGPGVKPQPHPEHPIVLPPDLPPTTPEGGKIEWKTAWTPQTGWIVVGVPAEGTLVPTPS